MYLCDFGGSNREIDRARHDVMKMENGVVCEVQWFKTSSAQKLGSVIQKNVGFEEEIQNRIICRFYKKVCGQYIVLLIEMLSSGQ